MTVKNTFLEKVRKEAKNYNDYLLTLPKDEIILHSYETYIKKELLWFFEEEILNNYNDLTAEDYKKIIKMKEEYYKKENKILEFLCNDITGSDNNPLSNYETTLDYIRNLINSND